MIKACLRQTPYTSFAALIISLSLFVWPAETLHAGEPANVIGTRVVDLDGNLWRLGLTERLSPVVVVILDTECPIANRYCGELDDFHQAAAEKGIELYGVLSDPFTTLDEAKEFRDKYKLKTPIIWDSNGDLALRLRPSHFPECFVINQQDEVVYRGRIDNRFVSVGKLRANITQHELKDAMTAVASGELPTTQYEKPVGCIFEEWTEAVPDQVDYNRHIAPIIYANCTACHRENEVAPFPLENYKDAAKRSGMISYVCEDRLMPPWSAEPGFGNFHQERFLSKRQIDLLTAWDEQGSLEGTRENQLAAPKFPADGWALGKPDMVMKMPEPFSVPAKGKDIYRYFVISNPLPRPLTIQAMDFRPGDKSVVHHMNSFVDFAGRARRMDAKDDEPGFSVFGTGSFMSYDGDSSDGAVALGGWVPGMGPVRAPEGYCIYIPAGGEVVIEIHYFLNGRATTDQSELAFYFAKGPVEKYVDGTVMGTQELSIPPEDKNYQRHFWMDVPVAIDLLDILPHMHYIGKSAKVVATLPDGDKVPLVNISNWDFRWQSLYSFREPIRLPAGSRIDAWFSFNNSSDNPANPSATPEVVKWGWQTGEEMAEVWLTYVPVDPNRADEIYSAAEKSWFRSGDPNEKPIDIPSTINFLKTKSVWSAKGEEILGQIYSMEKYDDLMAALDRAIANAPQNAQLRVGKGAILSMRTWSAADEAELNRLSIAADTELDAAIEIDNYNWDAWMTKAVFYATSESRQYETQAMGFFKQLIDGQEQYEQEPYFYKAYLEYARLQEKRQQPEKAKATLKRGLRFFKKNDELTQMLKSIDN